MKERYIAFDVETPNSANNRMSALGVAVVEGAHVVEAFSTLVNPECSFQPFNIQLTGITPEQVAQAPTFADLWPKLEPVFNSGILVAHNAQFDMSVLSKCLRAYDILWKPETVYTCTCRMGKRCYPELPNHRLNTMCEHLHIALDHHQAGSDSRACAELLCHYIRHGLHVERFLRGYDLLHGKTIRSQSKQIVLE